jgi:type IV pilus assembly protein PilO
VVCLADGRRAGAGNRAQRARASLRTDYEAKLQKAVSLEELKQQRVQVMQYVTLLEKQLPSKAEMDALLSDINQAGLGRSSAVRSVPSRGSWW